MVAERDILICNNENSATGDAQCINDLCFSELFLEAVPPFWRESPHSTFPSCARVLGIQTAEPVSTGDSRGAGGWGPAPELFTQKSSDVIITHETYELIGIRVKQMFGTNCQAVPLKPRTQLNFLDWTESPPMEGHAWRAY